MQKKRKKFIIRSLQQLYARLGLLLSLLLTPAVVFTVIVVIIASFAAQCSTYVLGFIIITDGHEALFDQLLTYLLFFSIVVSSLYLIIGGVRYTFETSMKQNIKKIEAKQLLQRGLAGLVICACISVILLILFSTFSLCPTTLQFPHFSQ